MMLGVLVCKFSSFGVVYLAKANISNRLKAFLQVPSGIFTMIRGRSNNFMLKASKLKNGPLIGENG